MSVHVKSFGQTKHGEAVDLITLESRTGMSCNLMSYGATIQSLLVPSTTGERVDVVLGYETLAEYEKPTNPFHGATVGRNANRIAKARIELNGNVYPLAATEGRNNLHSMPNGLDKVVWSYEIIDPGDTPVVKFHYVSPDGESGFPGRMPCDVIYQLTADHALSISYNAVSDHDTVINLTNHAYFNLKGAGKGTILDHTLEIAADFYTPIDQELLPDGRLEPVIDTPFDFDKAKPMGQAITATDQQLTYGTGYDHNYVIRGANGELRFCARAVEPVSGLTMTVETTSPGVQIYTGNHLNESGKGGYYAANDAFCLETQYYPNSLLHAHFPSPIFPAGVHFRHQTVYRFGRF
ncbi:MAG: galactose mutarotase [Eubacteriales bacterium]|nr:galactose mutarotase [Eubacteriales bacterium]